MPELPDVEIFTQHFQAIALEKQIQDIVVFDHRVLEETNEKELRVVLKGHRFVQAKRHGKYLLARISHDDWLGFHFGMTGFFKYFTDITKDSEHDSVRFDFKDGTFLAYDSTRKLGRVLLIRDDSAFLQEKNLGVDLLDPELTEERFVDLLSSRRGMIKSQLMNQALLAGLGNIYSDEVLFQAGIHPRTRIQNLTSGDLQRLYQVMHKVIAAAVKHKANPEQLPDWFFLPRRHVGGRCPVCGCELSTVLVSGRRGYVCTRCQPLKQKAP